MMQRLDRSKADFDEKLTALLRVPAEDAAEVRAIVAEILGDVRSGGDVRLVELTNQLDRRDVASAAELKICLLYTSPSPRDVEESRMPSSA